MNEATTNNIHTQNNPNNQTNTQSNIIHNLTEEEYSKIYFSSIRDIFPSTLALLLILTGLRLNKFFSTHFSYSDSSANTNPSNQYELLICHPYLHNILFLGLLLHIGFILKGLIKLFLLNLSIFNTKLTKRFFFYISPCMYLFYIIYTILGIYMLGYLPYERCLYKNTYSYLLSYTIIGIGVFDLVKMSVYIVCVVCSMPFFVYYFISDPKSYFMSVGVNPVSLYIYIYFMFVFII